MKMRLLNYIFFTVILLLPVSSVLATDKNIIDGLFESRNNTKRFDAFAVSKGDVIEITVQVNHKRRGLNIWMVQHPGNITVLDYEEFHNGTKTIVAPADAIYELCYGGSRVDFNLQVVQHTNQAAGSNRGDIVYVCMPDTLHVNGYVDKKIGENYAYVPYKEKAVLSTSFETEQITNRDFFTGVDIMKYSIPGDIKDEYREQKLLSYTVSLTCQSPTSYEKMKNVIKSGAEAVPDYKDFVGGVKNKNKTKKMDYDKKYELTDNLGKEQEKWDNIQESISLGQEVIEVMNEKEGEDNLSGMAYIMDTDGMKQMAVHKGLDMIGAPEKVGVIYDKVQNFPGTTELLQMGIDKYAPSVQGKALINVKEKYLQTMPYYDFGEKTFWIQSAMNYGANNGGFWDVPGSPSKGEKGLEIKCWDIDDGIDRKFKMVPSQEHKGYFMIVSALPGTTCALDNSGGKVNMDKNQNNIHLWEKHGGESQLFRFKHLGGGKFRIYNYDGYAVCLEGRKNQNGTNIHIWEDHEGAWMDWYLIDPLSKQKFIPEKEAGTANMYRDVRRISKSGGAINETVIMAHEDDPLIPARENVDIKVLVNKDGLEATAKLIIDARYRITDYTDIIKYKKDETPVYTKDFWAAYKIKYNYAIMFEDQVKDYYRLISAADYYNPKRPVEEEKINGDYEQSKRLRQYKLLTTPVTK